MNGLDSQLKGFLFFVGSLLQWPPKQPGQFLYFHLYILIVYALFAVSGLGLFLVLGAIAPLALAICKGLPLDCLAYEEAIRRESLDSSVKE